MATRLLDLVPMPPRIKALPRNHVGYPIPWFVATLDDGSRDFRIAGMFQQFLAVRDGLCWVCGGRLGAYKSFTIRPMCAVNRISAEPPSHRDCAVYSAQVCPFLTTPGMRRRPLDEATADDRVLAAGEMLERNPGVTLVWTTRIFRPFRPSLGNDGLLFQMGEPTETQWFKEGRPATRAEVTEALDAGLPALRATCDRDDDPALSRKELEEAADRARLLLPAS